MASALFGEDFLRRLEKLRLALVRSAGSRAEGLRLAGSRGGTGEFREHRNYAAGDEPRYIDWNLYGRLERLFLKEFTPEHEGRAAVCLDCSASMGAGPSGRAKFDFARRLAAAVAYIGLAGGDRVSALAFGAGQARQLALRAGPTGFYELLDFLERLEPAGVSGLRAAAERAAMAVSGGGRGVVVWISDLWMGAPDWPMLAPPPGRALDVVLARVLSPDEVAPRADGALVLVDSETGERLRIDGREAAARYEAAAAEHAGALAAFAARHRIRLAGATSDQSFEEAALELLSRSRLLQRT